ncbi:MAG: hypothetical protein A2X46_04140 [Lentisphaerae bacterium GWF2_57_35]|nr:MAG: hypothetical protein A2X46_04140 [Lentisphaerae bacterium GWF2_57_35]
MEAISAKPSLSTIKYRALVIGISDYARHHGDGWESLDTARNDAASIADCLEQRYGFEVQRLFDREATRESILVALDDLANSSSDDAILIYYAGHGYFDEALGEGYWIPSDARKTEGARQAREDWIWNSMITKLVGATEARHVLVIADSCYGGSLFRGEQMPTGKDLVWYQRAWEKPSRYLITSGDLEPVLDSGGSHSIFAQELLNYFNYPADRLFAASDLALAVRQKVSALTGQMVRMGPMPLAKHAGGEFIFKTHGVSLPSPVEEGSKTGGLEISGKNRNTDFPKTTTNPSPLPKTEKVQAVQDALALNRQGATNTAKKIISSLFSQPGEDRMVLAVAHYLSEQTRAQKRDALRTLIEKLETRKPQDRREGEGMAKPRIVGCLGPISATGGADADALALLVQICLRTELDQSGDVQVVEREALESILQEIDLGSSDLSDVRAQNALGKLLPAGMLLLGNIIPLKDAQQIHLRLVDAETSRIIGSFSASLDDRAPLDEICSSLASQIVHKAIIARPLEARITHVEPALVQAGIGRFHGLQEDVCFNVVSKITSDATYPLVSSETNIGQARVRRIGESDGEFDVVWSVVPPPSSADNLWLKERIH